MNAVDAYLATIVDRLASHGFERRAASSPYDAILHRARVDPSKFGFNEEFVICGSLDQPTLATIRQLSHDAWNYAVKEKSVWLPRGLGSAVSCYCVAMTDFIDDATAKALCDRTPTRHWASIEMPVVYETAHQRVISFAKTPLWGWLYYRSLRSFVSEMLSPDQR